MTEWHDELAGGALLLALWGALVGETVLLVAI